MLSGPFTMRLDDGRELEYYIDRGRRQNIYISVKEGRVVLKLPQRADAARGESFLRKKGSWVLKCLTPTEPAAVRPERFCEGGCFTLCGERYTLCCESAPKYFEPRFGNGKLVVAVFDGQFGDSAARNEYIDSQARKAIGKRGAKIITEAFERLCAQTGLRPRKLTVRKMSASWGRCSSSGNISINENVIFYPAECIDYVLIHELCHLVYMDHSADFWALVERYCPEHKRIRDMMR